MTLSVSVLILRLTRRLILPQVSSYSGCSFAYGLGRITLQIVSAFELLNQLRPIELTNTSLVLGFVFRVPVPVVHLREMETVKGEVVITSEVIMML